MLYSISSNFVLFLFICFLSIQLTFTLRCFECDNCKTDPSCACTQTVDVDENNFYCVLERVKQLDTVSYEIRHTSRNRTIYYAYDPHYISVDETINYNETTEKWTSTANTIIYGCHTDNCNRADLLKELPANGLSLTLPEDWLNKTLKRQEPGNLVLCRRCEEQEICGESPSAMNLSHICERQECQGSCFTVEKYQRAESSQFCYSSMCSDDTENNSPALPPQVNIQAVYYIGNGKFEVVQLDVICNGDDCSHLELFQDIKDKLQKNLDNIKAFLPIPHNHTKSIYSSSILFLFIILFLQTLNFY